VRLASNHAEFYENKMDSMPQLAGVFAPITTPFDAVTGDLDVVALRRNVRCLAETDLAGLVLFGSTGEGHFLDEVERREALSAVREIVPDLQLFAAAGAESTRAAIRLARQAAAGGADAVLVAPPAYYKPQMTPEALREHFTAVADGSPVPVILYQVPPAYSGVELQTGLVAELANHNNVVGIKDSTGDLRALGDLLTTCRPGFGVLVGSGAVLYGGLVAGAKGGILAVANLVPDWCCDIVRLINAGDDAQAGAIQERLTVLHRRIVAAHGIPGVKAALDILGQAGGPPRSPLRPLRDPDRHAVRDALASVGAIPQRESARDDAVHA